ncbi:MAG: Bro-N domain-containing protein [Alphaproteobacteria bacterium]|nr:Bro-N domain-containing protein [Alphaproteobacteria bacterium]
MTQSTSIKLFEDKNIRTLWDDKVEKWYFSVVDIISVLTDSDYQQARNYWKVLKNRLKSEGNETVTNCNQLKMLAPDGKMRETDVGDAEQILRLVQSIPSKKAEPFKQWLARVGSERLDEIADPEIAINRALETYAKKGYSLDWINQRLKTIEVRKLLTDEWDRGGVKKGVEYAILTDEIYKGWTGMNTRQYKKLKGLYKENLRDNMSNLELVLNMLAEATITEIAKKEKPYGLSENLRVAREGASVAGDARKKIESKTGKPVLTGRNAKELKKITKK